MSDPKKSVMGRMPPAIGLPAPAAEEQAAATPSDEPTGTARPSTRPSSAPRSHNRPQRAYKDQGPRKLKNGTRPWQVYLMPEGKDAIDELAKQETRDTGGRVTMNDLAREAFNDLLVKYGKPPLA